ASEPPLLPRRTAALQRYISWPVRVALLGSPTPALAASAIATKAISAQCSSDRLCFSVSLSLWACTSRPRCCLTCFHASLTSFGGTDNVVPALRHALPTRSAQLGQGCLTLQNMPQTGGHCANTSLYAPDWCSR